MNQVGHLDELHEKYGPKGLTVISISKEPASRIEAFIEKTDAKHPIISEKTDSMAAYGRNSYPSAVLIDARGKVLVVDHPASVTTEMIEEALASIRLLPAFPASLSKVEKAIGKQKFADALKKVNAAIEGEKVEGDELEAANEIKAWLEWTATSSLEEAAAALRERNVYDAFLAYERVAKEFKGHDYGKQAQAAAKEILKDKELKLEVDASKKLAKAKAKMAEESNYKKQYAIIKSLTKKKYENTKAGQEAQKIAEKLKTKFL